MAAKFEVYNDKVGKFRFRLRTGTARALSGAFRVPDRVAADRQRA
jgi:uncharacterized protein YegP (UPF0339 family)